MCLTVAAPTDGFQPVSLHILLGHLVLLPKTFTLANASLHYPNGWMQPGPFCSTAGRMFVPPLVYIVRLADVVVVALQQQGVENHLGGRGVGGTSRVPTSLCEGWWGPSASPGPVHQHQVESEVAKEPWSPSASPACTSVHQHARSYCQSESAKGRRVLQHPQGLCNFIPPGTRQVESERAKAGGVLQHLHGLTI